MENYNQLCVWPGTTLEGSTTAELESFFLEEMNIRIKYHTEVKTLPDLDKDDNPVPETGGRNDMFFYVHTDDITRFSFSRLKMGIQWWEDVVGYNDNRHLYTTEFLNAHPLNW